MLDNQMDNQDNGLFGMQLAHLLAQILMFRPWEGVWQLAVKANRNLPMVYRAGHHLSATVTQHANLK